MFQVIAEDAVKESVEKRQVSVLARDGNLPFEGKRYVGKEPQSSKTSDNGWSRNEDPSVFLATNKRYVGALAKTGDLAQFKQAKRNEDVDTLMDYLRKGEEMRRLRLEALREEMLREAEEDYEVDAEKRSLSSLARAGEFPMRASKRGGIASMARSGFLGRAPSSFYDDELGKRGISSLARNGQLPSFGKRGGVSSLMRNGFSHQKRSYGSDLDRYQFGEFDVLYKRNLASLARDYGLPNMGKRNIASFAKNGWLPNYGSGPKRSAYEYEDLDDIDESKRNLPSLLRNRMSPLTAGKRYLGAFVATNKLPYSRQSSDDFKRNIGSILRNSEFQQGRIFGKRDWDDEDDMSEDMTNDYVLPQLSNPQEYSENDEGKDFSDYSNLEDIDEQKRHIGSVLSQKSFMRKKKSITPEDQLEEQPPTTSSPTKSLSDENKMNNDIQRNNIRQKREAFADISDSDEYTMPVLQNTQSMEYEDENRDNEETPRKKRYFGKSL